jgi:hypothetical protein
MREKLASRALFVPQLYNDAGMENRVLRWLYDFRSRWRAVVIMDDVVPRMGGEGGDDGSLKPRVELLDGSRAGPPEDQGPARRYCARVTFPHYAISF